jgi:hypothetical protein
MYIKIISVIYSICIIIFVDQYVGAMPQSEGISDEKIEIKYTHSKRIPHQQIIFTLRRVYSNDENYKMDIKTMAMAYNEQNWNMNDENTRRYVESEEYKNNQIILRNRIEEFAKNNINETIDIEKEFFQRISNDIRKIDLENIIQENRSIAGADGSTVSISYGTYLYFTTINVWTPKNTKGEVIKVNDIVLEVFKKANLEEWYQ